MLLLNKRVEKLKDVPEFGEYSKKENNLEFLTHSRKNWKKTGKSYLSIREGALTDLIICWAWKKNWKTKNIVAWPISAEE